MTPSRSTRGHRFNGQTISIASSLVDELPTPASSHRAREGPPPETWLGGLALRMSRPFSRGPRSRQDHLAGFLDRGRPDAVRQ